MLHIYMNGHLAASVAGLGLARRAANQDAGIELGDFLARLADEIQEDKKALERLMGSLGAGRDRLKGLAASAGEKLGRLKLNGRRRGAALDGLAPVG